MVRATISMPFDAPVQYGLPTYSMLRGRFDVVDSLYQTHVLQLADPTMVIDTTRESIRLCYVCMGREFLKLDVTDALNEFGLRHTVCAELFGCALARGNDQRKFPILGFGSQIQVARGFRAPCMGVVYRKRVGRKSGQVRSFGLVNVGSIFGPDCRVLAAFLQQP